MNKKPMGEVFFFLSSICKNFYKGMNICPGLHSQPFKMLTRFKNKYMHLCCIHLLLCLVQLNHPLLVRCEGKVLAVGPKRANYQF